MYRKTKHNFRRCLLFHYYYLSLQVTRKMKITQLCPYFIKMDNNVVCVFECMPAFCFCFTSWLQLPTRLWRHAFYVCRCRFLMCNRLALPRRKILTFSYLYRFFIVLQWTSIRTWLLNILINVMPNAPTQRPHKLPKLWCASLRMSVAKCQRVERDTT